MVHLNDCIRRLEGSIQNNNIHLNNNYLQNKNNLVEMNPPQSQPYMPPPQAPPRVPTTYIVREPNENQHVPAFIAPLPRDHFVHPDQTAKDPRQHLNQKDQESVWRPW